MVLFLVKEMLFLDSLQELSVSLLDLGVALLELKLQSLDQSLEPLLRPLQFLALLRKLVLKDQVLLLLDWNGLLVLHFSFLQLSPVVLSRLVELLKLGLLVGEESLLLRQ